MNFRRMCVPSEELNTKNLAQTIKLLVDETPNDQIGIFSWKNQKGRFTNTIRLKGTTIMEVFGCQKGDLERIGVEVRGIERSDTTFIHFDSDEALFDLREK